MSIRALEIIPAVISRLRELSPGQPVRESALA